MKGAVAWFARNSVAANLLMGLLVVGGLLTLPTIPQKEFPDVDIDLIQVAVEYRGAAPEEVEQGVCIRVEEAVEGIEGLDRLRSLSTEGVCVVTVELLSGADAAKALDDVKSRVDALDTLPEETEKPIVQQATLRRAVVDVALAGDLDERSLKEIGERTRDEIARLPGITQVEVAGARPYEISIEVSEAALRRYGMTFEEVAQAVRRGSLDLPGGSIDTPGGEVLLRTQGQAYRGREFERLPVRTGTDGSRVLVGDVAKVVDGFEDVDQWGTFDGKPAVVVRVFRVGDQDIIGITDAVKAYVEEARARLPPGVDVAIWRDASRPLRGRIDTMLRNGRAGFLLVLLVLALFLRTRLAVWVALGVPIAFCGALFVLPMVDVSINVVSLFAFILVLGILVDDAVVVGENVYTHQQQGDDPLEASIRGTGEVAVPVIFGVLTTVVAFCPMLLVGGQMGQLFGVMAVVVIACLAFSLVEAQLILPAHLGHMGAPRPPRSAFGARVNRVQQRFADGMMRFVHGPYRRALEAALDWRYLTLAFGLFFLLVTIAVLASGLLRFSFFPPIEAEYISAQVTMPRGAPVEVTARAVARIEGAAARLREELDERRSSAAPDIVEHVLAVVGAQPSRDAQAENPAGAAGLRGGGGSHLGEVNLQLVAAEERSLKASEVAQRWRELTGPVPEAVELVFVSSLFSVGEPVLVQLQGPRVEELREAAERLKSRLAAYSGVIDIADSFRAGKQEVKLSLLPAGEAAGLTLQDLARQVRQAFYGEEAQRVQRGRHDVRVMVRYPEVERRSLASLEDLRLRTAEGTEVPFRSVATAELGRGFSSIQRADRQRVVNVTADVDRSRITEGEVLANLEGGVLAEILRDYPDVTASFEGGQRVQRQALDGLLRWTLVALFGIYTLLAVPLRSYGQPLLIMSVIPFGIVGAIFGHLVMKGANQVLAGADFQLSFMSITGIVALTGVVVNASLVLVYQINARTTEGFSLAEAVCDASLARFRPIVLTSITTFVGLAPLLTERSVQAQFLIPMATSLGFGVLFATLITLFVLPASTLILEDIRGLPALVRTQLTGHDRSGVPSPVATDEGGSSTDVSPRLPASSSREVVSRRAP